MSMLLVLFCSLFAFAAEPARNILVLADSHGIGGFGIGVEDALRMLPGAQVDAYAIGASQPRSFVKGFVTTCGYHGATNGELAPKERPCRKLATPLAATVAQGRDVVVIALGTNLINEPRGPKFAVESTRELALVVKALGARCLWVGPPHMRRYTKAQVDAIYLLINEALNPPQTTAPLCELVDSRPFTDYPAKGGDGIHYQWAKDKKINELGRRWGDDVGKALAALLR